MTAFQKLFSLKSAFVGAIIGISIGLGMINFEMCFRLGGCLAFVFGFFGGPRQSKNKFKQVQ
jgi:hypothetical protein